MNKAQLRRYIGYFIIIAISVTIISINAATLFRRETYNRTISILDRNNLVARNLLTRGDFDSLDEYFNSIAVEDVRITIIRSDGVVVADSQTDIGQLDNHADRPEILSALNGVPGRSKRYSNSLGEELLYVALPIIDIGEKSYVIRSSMSVADIDKALGDVLGRIIFTGIVTFLALSILSYLSERRFIAPLADIQKAAEAFSGGNLDHYLSVPGPEDIKVVADALNEMAGTLKSRLADITKGKNELDAVISSMMEAVVVLDMSLNIRHLNLSALNIIGSDITNVLGKALIEIFRSSDLQILAEKTLKSQIPIEKIINLNTDRNLILQVHGTCILPTDDKSTGNAVVLVMNDITQTQMLENMRRDFVANVSHELKTPITNVKGYLETLAEGVMNDPETTERFLAVSIRNADRLNAILDDLLSLSRLEQHDGEGLEFENHALDGIAGNAFQSCAPKAAEKNITLRLEGQKDLTARLNMLLIEQALTNLIDNAVKYSDKDAVVTVCISKNGEMAEISVRDDGIGIPDKDRPRIFERFYRVDKARSRELGGTGLGLAIVKHIIIVHRGSIRVDSELGKGSTFTLSIPLN